MGRREGSISATNERNASMKHYLILSGVALLIAAVPAAGSVQRGDTVLDFLGGWGLENAGDASNSDEFVSGATGDNYTGWLALGGLGHFTSDNVEIAIVGLGAWLGSDGVKDTVALREGFEGFSAVLDVDVDATVYGVGGRLLWHLAPANRLVPYLGVQGFWASADIDMSGTTTTILDGTGEVVQPAAHFSEKTSADGILWGGIAGLRWELSARNDLLVEYQYHRWGGDIADVLEDGHAVFIGISHQLN
jgi:hypothetical protein